MDAVFKALADSGRRELLDRLHARGGQSLRELSAGLGMTRQAVSQHLVLLEAAGLVATLWQGREKLHFLNPVPLFEISERWISKYQRRRLETLAQLKTVLEAQAGRPRRKEKSDDAPTVCLRNLHQGQSGKPLGCAH